MENVADELRRLRDDNPELTRFLDGYRESRRAYREALEARRVSGPRLPGSINSAAVTVSARPTVSLSEYTIPVANRQESVETG
jgi:hypothetical protein